MMMTMMMMMMMIYDDDDIWWWYMMMMIYDDDGGDDDDDDILFFIITNYFICRHHWIWMYLIFRQIQILHNLLTRHVCSRFQGKTLDLVLPIHWSWSWRCWKPKVPESIAHDHWCPSVMLLFKSPLDERVQIFKYYIAYFAFQGGFTSTRSLLCVDQATHRRYRRHIVAKQPHSKIVAATRCQSGWPGHLAGSACGIYSQAGWRYSIRSTLRALFLLLKMGS